MADALFTSTQQRVLGFLFGQPDRSFFVTELVALVDSGRGAVQRELERLARSGLVVVSKVGNQKHYQANDESPVFAELRSIVNKTVGLQEPLRAALDQIADRISLAIIYGSIAKGIEKATSDVDLLMVADTLTLEEVYTVLAPVEKVLNRRINPTLYTSKEFRHRREANNTLLSRVLDGQTVTLIGSLNGE